jgi:hypothetical protein
VKDAMVEFAPQFVEILLGELEQEKRREMEELRKEKRGNGKSH